jgi:hypothetical protein
MEAQTNTNAASIMKGFNVSTIALLSALLIFMLLVDMAMSPFVNSLIQSDKYTAGYYEDVPVLDQRPVISNGKDVEEGAYQICIMVPDFQTKQVKTNETTLVTQVPVRKILE